MSLRIQATRVRQMGDPGLFDVLGSIGKAIVGTVGGAVKGLVTGGPLGAITGGLGGLATSTGIIKTASVSRTAPITPVLRGAQQIPLQTTGRAMPGTGVQVQLPSVGSGGIDLGRFSAGSFGPMTGGGTPMVAGPNGQLCQVKGYHLNKSGYHTAQGYVPAGAKCVKNRRMNPLNPRAASRAMRRLDGFSRAARCVEKQLVKMARKNVGRGGGYSRSKGGCKSGGCRKR